jgi:hypothetical protein
MLRTPLQWNPIYSCFFVELNVMLLSRAPSPYYSVRDVHCCITRHVSYRPPSLLQETTIKPYATIRLLS